MDFNNEERPGKLFNSYIQVDNYLIEKQSKTEVNYFVRTMIINGGDRLEEIVSGDLNAIDGDDTHTS